MRDVMLKAQALGEAILASDVYKRKNEAESKVATDETAAAAVAAYMEKRHAVEELLGDADMDPGKLAEAGAAMQEAEEAMNANPVVKEVKAASDAYNTMMDNINRLLRLIVDGEVDAESGCTGSCETCAGCH